MHCAGGAAAKKTAPLLLLLAAMVLLLEVRRLQAEPVASLQELAGGWREEPLERMGAMHSSCDEDYFQKMLQESCQYHRRRRRGAGADTDAETLGGGGGVAHARLLAARVKRSPVADLFSKCCERRCNVEDFVGVCP